MRIVKIILGAGFALVIIGALSLPVLAATATPTATGPDEKPAPAASMPAFGGRLFKAGSFGEYVELRATLEMNALRLKNYELTKKMPPPETEKEPQNPPPLQAVVPPVQPPAQPSVPALEKLAPVPTLQDAVISVLGVDGNLSAVIRTSAGRQVTVKKGDKFGGGTVAEISRSGVVVIRGKTFSTIQFE
jgi:type IV pilus biogenesis protein PilP